MNVWTWHHRRRYLYISLSLLFSLIIFAPIRFFHRKRSSNNRSGNRLDYCDQTIIRKHFMHNKSPEQLFDEDPSRKGFTYELKNGNFCSLSSPHALIFIVSKSSNFDSRNAIRRTWGNFDHILSLEKFAHLRIKLLFLIDINESHLLRIKLEQTLYQDIVQVRLPEYYALSTHRDMAILYWTNIYCPKAMITVKTDDDIFLNIYLLVNIINSILVGTNIDSSKLQCNSSDSSAIIYGVLLENAKVVRHSSDPILEGIRYIITDLEYPCIYYPDYMSGFGYIVNRHARTKLLCTFSRDPTPFHLSDVYITGILPEYVDIERKHLGLSISYQANDGCEHFFSQDNPDAYACASSLHYRDKQIDIFERFNVYWQRIYEHRFLYLNQNFSFLNE